MKAASLSEGAGLADCPPQFGREAKVIGALVLRPAVLDIN